MKKYLLDTCVVSDYVKGEPGTRAHLAKISPLYVALSSVTVMEIYYGLYKNPDRARKIEKVLMDFIDAVDVIPFAAKEAKHAAMVRSWLEEQGKPIGPYDIQIAGAAIANDCILVTSNTREFKRLPELTLENWRKQVTAAT